MALRTGKPARMEGSHVIEVRGR
jgi:chromosome segregation ATPase